MPGNAALAMPRCGARRVPPPATPPAPPAGASGCRAARG